MTEQRCYNVTELLTKYCIILKNERKIGINIAESKMHADEDKK